MHGQTMSGWLLVALCAGTGAYGLLRLRGGRGEHREGAAGEALMGFGMAVMAVPAAVLAPPAWGWMLYAAVFGAAALRGLWLARTGAAHAHHLVGSLAMVYMAWVMAPGGAGSGHAGHAAGYAAGGIPLLTGALLLYYAVYVVCSGARLIPVAAGPGGGALAPGARQELAPACQVSMGMGMIAMLLTL
ncbi:DUF5134 domain-containing protein [Streptomyces agglomeratus]|uniref:DUF5134 domain-containing protein n=1 Tax=Streptomyces agglomeratus TaxID=285458 RepID=UPI0008547719|nr:DUF5134 domain-containing protein [Streptomyces agglomeratus]OEJ37774.1 DUF5134 domain-containing protein [Streptomyces agglomeratus]OEJ50310.1 DUF5134 domain-containing protein [Streptomyces agglomeratus]OEJ57639.1 DUF5134 domain-containing protein [Streptomyces agglomeratus]